MRPTVLLSTRAAGSVSPQRSVFTTNQRQQRQKVGLFRSHDVSMERMSSGFQNRILVHRTAGRVWNVHSALLQPAVFRLSADFSVPSADQSLLSVQLVTWVEQITENAWHFVFVGLGEEQLIRGLVRPTKSSSTWTEFTADAVAGTAITCSGRRMIAATELSLKLI